MCPLRCSYLNGRTLHFQLRRDNFYIASHHGHSSGFSTELFAAMGRSPFLNLVSVHSRDENVDSRYSSEHFARGVKLDDETRYMLSTRNDGSIFVDVNLAGQFGVYTLDLGPNLAAASS